MNFKLHGRVSSSPVVNANLKMEPLQFDTTIGGGCECEVSRLSAYIGEIGVRFAIPFMPPRRHLPLVATVGGFHIRVKPFQLKAKGIHLRVAGNLGSNGLAASVDAKAGCSTDLDLEGKLPLKGRINVDLCNADELVD